MPRRDFTAIPTVGTADRSEFSDVFALGGNRWHDDSCREPGATAVARIGETPEEQDERDGTEGHLG